MNSSNDSNRVSELIIFDDIYRNTCNLSNIESRLHLVPRAQ